MKFSQNILVTSLFSLMILSSLVAKAQEDLSDLEIESEIVSADKVFDLEAESKSRKALYQERKLHKNELPRLREEIRKATATQIWAQKQIQTNEKEATRLEKERKAAETDLAFANLKLQRTDRLLKSAQDHLLRRQKAREIIVEKRNAAIKRMNERIDASHLLIAKVEQADQELKAAEAQYQKTLQREREQKVALGKKQTQLKKRIAEINFKANRIKSPKKVLIGRAP